MAKWRNISISKQNVTLFTIVFLEIIALSFIHLVFALTLILTFWNQISSCSWTLFRLIVDPKKKRYMILNFKVKRRSSCISNHLFYISYRGIHMVYRTSLPYLWQNEWWHYLSPLINQSNLKERYEGNRTQLINIDGLVFYHDNAGPCITLKIRKMLRDFIWEVLMHPPDSKNLSCSTTKLVNYFNVKNVINEICVQAWFP